MYPENSQSKTIQIQTEEKKEVNNSEEFVLDRISNSL